MSIVQSVDAESVASVLTEIAEIASETLELQEVFDRVAASVRRLIPFDNMGVVRILDGEHAVLHATTVPCKDPAVAPSPIPLTSWSPRMRPRPGPIRGSTTPRPSSTRPSRSTRDVLRGRRALRPVGAVPLGGALRGGVWLSSYSAHAFTDEHQELLRPIAALLGSAVEHWRIWDAERRRRERLDQLEALLGTLAESLDVREVFPQLSDAHAADPAARPAGPDRARSSRARVRSGSGPAARASPA